MSLSGMFMKLMTKCDDCGKYFEIQNLSDERICWKCDIRRSKDAN